MSTKNADLIANPFIKPKNRHWTVEPPRSLVRSISPPTTAAQSRVAGQEQSASSHHDANSSSTTQVPTAAIEAGEAKVRDHLDFFSGHLTAHVKSNVPPSQPLLTIPSFVDLYKRNLDAQGRHFVIHQHDHPIAGTHYDLRLQINETSSVSFACMYGLPGNANSRRLNRNATETRIHNLWNHLIETASHATGSLLIWDTGEYEVLPRPSKHDANFDPDSASSGSDEKTETSKPTRTEQEKLHEAFQNRKITLRLHGTRLPKNYTIAVRLSKEDKQRNEQPKKPARKRRRKIPSQLSKPKEPDETPPSSDTEILVSPAAQNLASAPSNPSPSPTALAAELQEAEDEQVRLTNAYPGAKNSIHSIHQRKWFLSLDRPASGFYKAAASPVRWERCAQHPQHVDEGKKGRQLLGFEPFFVRGADVETSVVTGRTAREVLADEGVVNYVNRKGWRPVLE